MGYIIERLKFWKSEDRLGPDIPTLHILSYFPKYYNRICKKKFLHWGDGSELRPGAYAIYCSTISVGNNVIIRPGSMIFGDSIEEPIIIEDDVLLGAGVHIYSDNHLFENPEIKIKDQGYIRKKVLIKEGAWIGSNVIILPGVTIGEHAVVGAGSVVTKDIPSFTLYAGNPAKMIRKIS